MSSSCRLDVNTLGKHTLNYVCGAFKAYIAFSMAWCKGACGSNYVFRLNTWILSHRWLCELNIMMRTSERSWQKRTHPHSQPPYKEIFSQSERMKQCTWGAQKYLYYTYSNNSGERDEKWIWHWHQSDSTNIAEKNLLMCKMALRTVTSNFQLLFYASVLRFDISFLSHIFRLEFMFI